MGRMEHGQYSPAQPAKHSTSTQHPSTAVSEWYKGLVLGLALFAGYPENLRAQEVQKKPTPASATPDLGEKEAKKEPSNHDALSEVPRVVVTNGTSATAAARADKREPREQLVEIYSALTKAEIAATAESLKEKSPVEILRMVVTSLADSFTKTLEQRQQNKLQQEENQARGKALDEKLLNLAYLAEHVAVIQERFAPGGKVKEFNLPHSHDQEGDKSDGANPAKNSPWPGIEDIVIGLGLMGAAAYVYRMRLLGLLRRDTVSEQWADFEKTHSKPAEPGIQGEAVCELQIEQMKLCLGLKERFPTQLVNTLSKFGLEPKLMVGGTLVQWTSRLIKFSEIDEASVGVSVDLKRLEDLDGLAFAIGKNYLTKNPHVGSFVSAILSDASKQLLHESSANGTKKERSEWKNQCDFFKRWTLKLGMPEAGLFERLLAAADLPPEVFSFYREAEIARNEVPSSPNELSNNLKELNSQLVRLTSTLSGHSLSAKHKSLLIKLLTGLCNDCAIELDKAESFIDPGDPFSCVQLYRNKLIDRLREINASPVA